MSYAEKLKDPRWQKKRIKILERDSWACQCCFNTEAELQVHHRVYRGGDPWEIDNKYLVTLCKKCHENESQTDVYKRFVIELKTIFMADDVHILLEGFKNTPLHGHPSLFAGSINWLLTDKDMIQKVYTDYIKSISKKKANDAERVC